MSCVVEQTSGFYIKFKLNLVCYENIDMVKDGV